MQKHYVDITERIELAAAISAQSDQSQWSFGLAVSMRSSGSGTEDVLQQNINQFSSSRADFATTPARLMLQAQPMLFDFEKLFVKREGLRWASGSCGRETVFGVRQNLVQMSGHSHRGIALNLRAEIQNPKRRGHRVGQTGDGN
jgi:hypothetical protein